MSQEAKEEEKIVVAATMTVIKPWFHKWNRNSFTTVLFYILL